MKKSTLLFLLLVAFILNVTAQQSIIKETFKQYVEYKIASVQKVISITEEQAEQLKELEYNFLLDVNATENCFLCRKKSRIEKLEKKKDEDLQTILERDQYIKYSSLENGLLQENPRIQVLDKTPLN